MQAENNPRPAGRLDRWVQFLAILAVVILCLSFGTSYYTATRPTLAPTLTLTPIPSPTLPPTATPTAPPSARPTGAAPKPAYLPGLTPDEVNKKFLSYMFQCGQPQTTAAGLYQWTCRLESSYATSEVRTFSRTPETVDQVVADIRMDRRQNIEEVSRFLTQVAELPYAGSEPDAAVAWVKYKLPDMQPGDEPLQAVFGDTLFRLYRTAEGDWVLELGELPVLQ